MSKDAAPRATLGRRLHYAIEFLFFKARDWLSPPERKLSEVGIEPGWRVLDFGCGIGGYAVAAARLMGEDGKVYAADINPAHIERVKTLAARFGLGNIQTVVTGCDTALESGTIDAALLYDVLHHLERPEQVVAELARVLKPEGILSVSDHHMREAQMLSRLTAGGLFEPAGRGKLTYEFRRSRGSR
jgi:ubiquinone/menaquinone biosynthesis C-methylase UbiE